MWKIKRLEYFYSQLLKGSSIKLGLYRKTTIFYLDHMIIILNWDFRGKKS